MTKIEHDLVTCALRDILDTSYASEDVVIRLSEYMDENCSPRPTAEDEREAVVKYLRKQSDEDSGGPYWYDRYEVAAEAIEKGEHRR